MPGAACLAWPQYSRGALDRLPPSFCLSQSVCVGVVYCVGCACELICVRSAHGCEVNKGVHVCVV